MNEILSLREELELIGKRYDEYWSSATHTTSEMLIYLNTQMKSINNVTKIIAATTATGNFKNIAYNNCGDIIEQSPDNDIFINLDKTHTSISEMNLSTDNITILNREMDAWGIPKDYMCREIVCELVNMVENGEIEPTDHFTYKEFKIVIGKIASLMSVSYNSVVAGFNAMIRKADFSKSIVFKDFNTMTGKHTVIERFITFIADNVYEK